MEQEKKKRTPIISLWKKHSQKGEYFSGTLNTSKGDINIVIFPNSFKTEENNQPDWYGYKSEPKKESNELGNLE